MLPLLFSINNLPVQKEIADGMAGIIPFNVNALISLPNK